MIQRDAKLIRIVPHNAFCARYEQQNGADHARRGGMSVGTVNELNK